LDFFASTFSNEAVIVVRFQAQTHAHYPYSDPIFAGSLVAYAPHAVVSVLSSNIYLFMNALLALFAA
jgi:hypothetical protein